MPIVEVIPTGQFRWRQLDVAMTVDSDIDELVEILNAASSRDVLQVRVSGTCNLAGHRKLIAALGVARAKSRAVVWDSAMLRLEPTEEDIQSLQADGFVGEVLQELRAAQSGSDPELARDAILALARVLDDAQGARSGAAA